MALETTREKKKKKRKSLIETIKTSNKWCVKRNVTHTTTTDITPPLLLVNLYQTNIGCSVRKGLV